MEMYSLATVRHFPFSYLDHLPICLDLYGWKPNVNFGPKPFLFEAMWVRYPEYDDVIKKSLNFTKEHCVVSFLFSSLSNTVEISKCGIRLLLEISRFILERNRLCLGTCMNYHYYLLR